MMYSLLSRQQFSFKILTSVCGCKTVSLSPVGLFWNRVGFGGVSGEWAGRGQVSPEEVAAQCGLGDMGQMHCKALRRLIWTPAPPGLLLAK